MFKRETQHTNANDSVVIIERGAFSCCDVVFLINEQQLNEDSPHTWRRGGNKTSISKIQFFQLFAVTKVDEVQQLSCVLKKSQKRLLTLEYQVMYHCNSREMPLS